MDSHPYLQEFDRLANRQLAQLHSELLSLQIEAQRNTRTDPLAIARHQLLVQEMALLNQRIATQRQLHQTQRAALVQQIQLETQQKQE